MIIKLFKILYFSKFLEKECKLKNMSHFNASYVRIPVLHVRIYTSACLKIFNIIYNLLTLSFRFLFIILYLAHLLNIYVYTHAQLSKLSDTVLSHDACEYLEYDVFDPEMPNFKCEGVYYLTHLKF